MTGAELAMFALLLGSVAGFWLTLFYLFPLIARAKFQYRATVLRDKCMDAVLGGRLRRTPPVESFLVRANAMAERPDLFTLARALAVHRTMHELNWRPEVPSQDCLKPEERELLGPLNAELEHAFVQRLIFGSSFGWLLWLVSLALRALRPKRRSDVAPVATPQHLAREYSAASLTVPIKGQKLVSLSH